MKKKLKRIIKRSPITDVSINYGGDKIKFNLVDELKIVQQNINDELKEQPSYTGFLGLLLVKLNTIKLDREAQLIKTENELFIEFKEDVDPNTSKPYSNDLAMSYARSEDAYQEALKEYHKALENHDIIEKCVNSFNSRAFLIQTLSANTRDERKLS